MLGPHVSRTEQRGVVALEAESNAAAHDAADDDPALAVYAVSVLGLRASFSVPEAGCPRVAEPERRRLMCEITRLMANSPIPEATRLAGLTLIGWLARRRIDEAPHAIGIPEARESERRIRAKAR
jgi:hypothetical protein